MKTAAAMCLAAACLSAGCGLAYAAEVWRLGECDGSGGEFRRCRAWEYGSEKWVAASPQMDAATYTWRHEVPGPGVCTKSPVPSELCSRSAALWMPDEEVVSGLRLVWKEPAAASRLLRIDCASFYNACGNGWRGVEILLDDGRKKVYDLPPGHASNRKGCFSMEAVVPVAPGENAATIRVVTLGKLCKIGFDAISLHETDRAADFRPVLEASTDAYSGIAHPGDDVGLVLRLFNAEGGTCGYVVTDVASNEVARGSAEIRSGTGRAALPSGRRGWFRVEAECLGAKATTAYAVVEPPEDAFIDDSRFGCHAVQGDGYRLHDSRFRRWRMELKGRRAFFAGAKWARLHYLSWACREPERDRYVWDDLDRTIAQAERNRLRVLMNVVEVPKWNSPTNDTRLTVCGAMRYKMHPPADMSAWARFVETLVSRYRGRVEDFEIGNEPGFTSAFWMTGSPEDFAAYLKTAYEAAHRANPACRIYPGAPLDTTFHEAVVRANGGRPYYDVLSGHYLGNGARFCTKTAGWLALNAKFGMPREMVNSEDMNWRTELKRGGVQADVAAHMVKLHVRDAARGVKRTFAFQAFEDLSGSYSFFDIDDAPYPTFAAYRAMTHRLEHAKYVGDLSGEEFEAYVFDRRGTPVTVCWNALGVPFSAELSLGGDATVADAMDVETRCAAGAEGLVKVALSAMPCYVEGGDWAAIKKAIAERPRDFMARGGNALGANMAQSRWPEGRPFRGRSFVQVAKDVPVRYGETYVFAAKIRGEGELNGIYTVRDRDGRELFPCRQGLNCLVRRRATGEWTSVSETVAIAQEGAARLSLTLVPNFYAGGGGTIEVRDVTVARVSDTYSVSKALHRGAFGRGAYGAPIAIPGATARVKVDGDALCVAFDVEDDVYDPPDDASRAYLKDSVQFAVDPFNDGTDYTCLAVGSLKGGGTFVFKEHNYSTPELPDNITRRGLVADAKVAFERTDGGWRIAARIPMRELYPLKAEHGDFGFDFLVNDCDGGGRTYAEWTEGIGGHKSAAPFGHLSSE